MPPYFCRRDDIYYGGVILSKKLVRETNSTVFNPHTGETTLEKKEISFLNPWFDEEKGYLLWPRKNFAKSYQTIDFPKELNWAERGRLATLAKKIWSNTNMLGYRGNGGIRPYDIKQIGEIIGLKERAAGRFMRKMELLKIIKQIPVKFGERTEIQYYFNPVYYFSNSRLSFNLYLLFREELDVFVPDWVKKEFAGIKTTKDERNKVGI